MANELAHDFEHDQPSERVVGISPASRTVHQTNMLNANGIARALQFQAANARQSKTDLIRMKKAQKPMPASPWLLSTSRLFGVRSLKAGIDPQNPHGHGTEVTASMSGAELRNRNHRTRSGADAHLAPES